MTTWSKETISKVSRLYSEITSDNSLYNANQRGQRGVGDAEAHVKERVAKEFVDRCAKECDVTVHVEDLVFVSQRSEDHAWLTTVKVRWGPETQTIELRGAHRRDGLMVTLQNAPRSPLVMEHLSSPVLMADKSDDPCPPIMQELWEMSGWSEDQRHWVYSLTQSRQKE